MSSHTNDQPATRDERWRRLKRKMFPRGLTFTREGRVYGMVTRGVGFAAVNTANNLLFLVLGLMLGLIVVSGILSEVALRDIRIVRRLPREIRAGRPFPAELSLENLKRRAASYSIELRDEIDGRPFKRRCYFLKVAPGETRAISYKCELDRRGRVSFDGVIISTRFPFGLFEKNRFLPLQETAVVFPRQLDVQLPFAASEIGEGSLAVDIRGPGQDFRELREMGPSDDPRKIHWPATAKLGRFLVRENDAEASSLVEIVLDASSGSDAARDREAAERHIAVAGSLAESYLDCGSPVRLVTGAETVLTARRLADISGLLTHLALLDVRAANSAAPPVGSFHASILIGPRATGVGRAVQLAAADTWEARS